MKLTVVRYLPGIFPSLAARLRSPERSWPCFPREIDSRSQEFVFVLEISVVRCAPLPVPRRFHPMFPGQLIRSDSRNDERYPFTLIAIHSTVKNRTLYERMRLQLRSETPDGGRGVAGTALAAPDATAENGPNLIVLSSCMPLLGQALRSTLHKLYRCPWHVINDAAAAQTSKPLFGRRAEDN